MSICVFKNVSPAQVYTYVLVCASGSMCMYYMYVCGDVYMSEYMSALVKRCEMQDLGRWGDDDTKYVCIQG